MVYSCHTRTVVTPARCYQTTPHETDHLCTRPKPKPKLNKKHKTGLITVFRYSYLISITRRQQVAQIRGLPIYVVTEVALTPCTSQADAAQAVAATAAAARRRARAEAEAEKEKEDQNQDRRDHSDAASTASSSVAGDDAASPDPDTDPDSEATGGRSGRRSRVEVGTDEADDDPATDVEGGAAAVAAAATGWVAGAGAGPAKRSSIAQDVISKRGSYGRFAQRWFSRSGWAMDQKRTMGLSAEDRAVGPVAAADVAGKGKGSGKFTVPSSGGRGAGDGGGSEAAVSLLPKLLRTSQILFGSSKTFFFSYDYDITRSMANPRVPENGSTPLHEQVEPMYFWNRHIMEPFIEAGADSLALPLMQGFVGQRSFVVDSHPPQVDDEGAVGSVELRDFGSSWGTEKEKATAEMRPTEKKFDITVISRRSIKRAGLRYLRRGIDEDGNVANSVETEQILSPAEAAWDAGAKVYSFVQIRGSFPLFFTQSPYSLKPAPVLRHSPDANFAALKKHFEGLRRRYGGLQVVNLVEKHGVEAPIAELYEQSVQRLNEEESSSQTEKIGFEWFDFHAVCRGMKFENVSFLLQILSGTLERFGSSVSVDGRVVATQKGVLRTNCMDCLDRTNVCQSSFAKHMLDLQLKEQGFDMDAQLGQENAWFNTLWADNGDAISKQYASTGAMKGDYTRTRKRNYRGALTDAGLSLTRLFNGSVDTRPFVLCWRTPMVLTQGLACSTTSSSRPASTSCSATSHRSCLRNSRPP